MNLVFRIVFGILVWVIFVSITYSTFFLEKQAISMPSLRENIIDESALPDWLYYKSISNYNWLYTSGEFLQDIDSDTWNISLSNEGKYLSSFRDIGSFYNFTWTGYVISQEGIWEVFIDTVSKQGKVFVYAKNTPATITLTSEDGQREYTNIYLDPWMYIEFRTGIWRNLNNADRLRIATVNNLWYIGSLRESNIDSKIDVYFSWGDNFFNKAHDFIGERDADKNNFFTEIISSTVLEIPGNLYIQRYLNLFVNNEKKKVFYKNILIESYLWLLKESEVKDSLLVDIKKDEQKLREIDEASYFEVLGFREDITVALYSTKNYNYIPAKVLFAKLLDSKIDESELMYPLFSFSLFSWESEIQWDSEKVTRKFFDSFSTYMTSYSNTQNRYDYFLYFLEQRLLYILAWRVEQWNIGNMVEFLSNYTNLSLEAQYKEKNQKITQIYSITKILEALDIFIREEYFLEERTQDKILVLRNNIAFDSSKISLLNSNISLLYEIYESNENSLNSDSPRDKEIINDIIWAKQNIDEYIIAITNYSEYKDAYSASTNSILWVNVIQNNQFEISEDAWKKYLEQFIWISQQSYTLSVIDDLYYKVENLIVGGRRFNFEIYPYSASRLKNIVIDGEAQTTQYALDIIQDDWTERYQTAPEDEKENYNFSRFFIITFLSEQTRNIENFEFEITQQESKAEIVFKRDILLWDRWEFAWLTDYLDIEYSDISLVQEGDSYNIFLKDIDYNIELTGINNTSKILWEIYSQYVLNTQEHTFKDLSVTIKSDKRDSNNNLLYELWWTQVRFIWNIFIDDLQWALTEMLWNLDTYLKIYSVINWSVRGENVSIEYTPNSKKTRFKFDSNWKSFTIILNGAEITGIYLWIKKLASSPINPQEIESYLQ